MHPFFAALVCWQLKGGGGTSQQQATSMLPAVSTQRRPGRSHISVRSILQQANTLLPEDHQSAATVESVAVFFEKQGVSWSWQMAHLDYSHWASAGASIGLYSAAMEAILAAANDKAPSAEERNETERPAPTSALEELPDDVRRFLLLPNRSTGEAAQPFKSILANLYAASRLKSIEEQREILRACGELVSALSFTN